MLRATDKSILTSSNPNSSKKHMPTFILILLYDYALS